MEALHSIPCLHCGYDLRASFERRTDEYTIRCPECGVGHDAPLLRRQGVRSSTRVQLGLLAFVPSIILLLSAWFFATWSDDSVHALLCLFFAPVVISVHAYAIWQFIDAVIVLPHMRQRRLKAAALLMAVFADVAACIMVAIWFV